MIFLLILNSFNDVLSLIVVKKVSIKKFWMNVELSFILMILNEFNIVINIVNKRLLMIGVGI